MTQLSHKIAENIKNARLDCGWSQSELAHNCEVTSAAISLIEKGDRTPSLPVLFKIAKALKVSIYNLIENNQRLTSAEKFYAKFHELENLSKKNQNLILSLIKRLSHPE